MDQKAKGTAKDFFFYLAGFTTLYVSVIALISLLFQIINQLIPDLISNGYYTDVYGYSAGMRLAIASLIIVFPLYFVIASKIDSYLRLNPDKKDVPVRKLLTYLTLFLTSAAVVTDLVVLVNSFLGGETTTRFVLKALVVLVVAGVTFAYYIYDLRKTFDPAMPSRTKFLVGGAALLVLISLVFGFIIMGSPMKARLLRIDMDRINDLQSIQWEIVNHFQTKKTLPTDLSALTDSISGYVAPTDPETLKSYVYEKTGNLSFKLCADFSLENKKIGRNSYPSMYGVTNESWEHSGGTVCFDRTIDPDKYPTFQK